MSFLELRDMNRNFSFCVAIISAIIWGYVSFISSVSPNNSVCFMTDNFIIFMKIVTVICAISTAFTSIGEKDYFGKSDFFYPPSLVIIILSIIVYHNGLILPQYIQNDSYISGPLPYGGSNSYGDVWHKIVNSALWCASSVVIIGFSIWSFFHSKF